MKNQLIEASFRLLFGKREGKLNEYTRQFPTIQNSLDIFKDEWASSLPPPHKDLKAGKINLFEDERLDWCFKKVGGVKNKTVLELGPLEGGHSYMLQKNGASSVTAIEANPRAFLKCLIVKQTLNLDKVHFLYGDFMEYLRQDGPNFDLCIASGVLYHMVNPVEMIALLAKRCSEIFLWTHYYDPEICRQTGFFPRFSAPKKSDYEGFQHNLYRHHYKKGLSLNSFCGGPEIYSHWLSREDILASLKYFGFSKIEISFEKKDTPVGPSFALIAQR